MKKVKVFPLPYAGASVSVYYRWKSLLPDNYELIMLELAGRGSRLGENFYQTVDEASEDIASKIKNVISGDDYILFGHSMGALLAYEVYFRLLEKQVKPAIHVIFSGQNTPYAINSIDGIENLNDSDFISMVEQYGGLPESFYDKEVRGFFFAYFKG